MKKAIIFTLIQGIMSIVQLNAQSMGNSTYAESAAASPQKRQELSVNVSSETYIQAEILYNAKPTSYTAILCITKDAKTSQEVDKLVNDKLNTLKTGLSNIGLGMDKVYVDFVSLVPKYEIDATQKSNAKIVNELPTGFQLKKNIHITFTDAKMLDQIASLAAQSEIYDLAKVDVNIPNIDAILEEMRQKALRVTENKLKLYNQMGIKATAVGVGDNFAVHYPTDQYESYSAFTQDAGAIQNYSKFYKGKLDVRVATKDRTIYYNRLPYNQFDYVFFPEYLEPPVQIHYKMSLRCIVENEVYAQKIKKENEEAAAKVEARVTKDLELQKQIQLLQQTNQTQIQLMMNQSKATKGQ
jgi:hypothetical protein